MNENDASYHHTNERDKWRAVQSGACGMSEVETAKAEMRRCLEDCLVSADTIDEPGLAAKIAEVLDWLDRYF